MYAVRIKPSATKNVRPKRDEIWVKDRSHLTYVGFSERGVWPTREAAAEHIAEPWEIVVEARD